MTSESLSQSPSKHRPHQTHRRASDAIRTTKALTQAERDGLRLREIRLQLGLTQGDFGREIGVTPNQVSRYERGVRTPKKPLMRLAQELLAKQPRVHRKESCGRPIIPTSLTITKLS